MEVNASVSLVAIGAVIITALASWFVMRKALANCRVEAQSFERKWHELEKNLHLKERDFLEERNQLESACSDKVRAARGAAYAEGQEFGRAQKELEHLAEISRLQADFAIRLISEREVAANEAREKLRADYELQNKLFSVQISPFVRVTDVKELFSTKHEAEAGYQYQLLVNGIPAFQPHVIIERTETRKEVNEENIRELAGAAKQFANSAISMYLGGAPGQFANLAPAVIKRLTKS
jgi:hypothetical protein